MGENRQDLARRPVGSPWDSQEVIFPSSPLPEENILKHFLRYNFRMENKSKPFVATETVCAQAENMRE